MLPKSINVIFVEIVSVAFVIYCVQGFTVGVPPLPTVCTTMTPMHHKYLPQEVESPFSISVDRNEVSGGSYVNVNLASLDPKTKFIGFYVQARDINDGAVGSFTPNDFTKVHSCSGMRANAAHHASGEIQKDNVTISWRPPKNYQGEVVLTATVLRDFVTYWVFLMAEPVIVKGGDAAEQSRGVLSPAIYSSNTRPNPFRLNSLTVTRDGSVNIFQTIQMFANNLVSSVFGVNRNRNAVDNSRVSSRNDIGNSASNYSNHQISQAKSPCLMITFFKFRFLCLVFQGR